MIKKRCTCGFIFEEEADEDKEPKKYCGQCGRNQFKGQSYAWKAWAMERGIIREVFENGKM